MSEKSSENRRSWSTLLKADNVPVRYPIYFSLFSIAVMVLLAMVYRLQFQQMTASLELVAQSQPDLAQAILDSFQVLFLISMVGFAIFSFCLFVVGILVYQRIFGPQVAILWQLDQIKQGEFDKRRNLRKLDELQPIMTSIHDLADRLKSNPPRTNP